MTLGGNVVIRNGNSLDFCWREAVNSLLPVCDMVSISDGESSDGTQEEIRQWMAHEPKLVLNVYPWPNPKGNPSWFVEWLDYNRQHVKADWQIQLDGDEVLSERSYEELKAFIQTPNRTAICTRYNFWGDHRHTIPEGVCLGKRVVRVAPQNIFLASDGYHHKGEQAASMSVATNIEIFHYGFIRKHEAFFVKERQLQNFFFDSYDSRLEAAEKNYGKDWPKDPGVCDYHGRLEGYDGPHPLCAHQWLRDRGFEP